MKLVSKKEIPKEICYDLSIQKNHNFFANGLCVHNTNASVVFSSSRDGGHWCQSRENIITPEKDNAGFAMFAHTNMPRFESIASNACKAVFADQTTEVGVRKIIEFLTGKNLVIFGEWCGSNIQSGVALNQLPKMFVIFGIAFVDAEGQKTYLTREQVCNATASIVVYSHVQPEFVCSRIFNIYQFPTYEIEIDFENPHEAVNTLNAITEKIGDECPVGKALGASIDKGQMTGEGIVWRCVTPGYEDSGFWMKVKDERHSNSKVKTLATVDVEKINNIKLLAESVAHEGRLQQQYDLVFDTLNGGEADIKKMGEFIKAVMQDIFKEEIDMIAASGFTGKELNGPVSKIVREFLMKKLEV